MADYRHFRVRDEEGVTLIELQDPKLNDTLLVTELQDELLEYLDQHHPRQVLISFASVTHCSTAVINGLLRTKKRLLADQGQLKLCGMRDAIREAYRMLNLDGTVFEIHDDCDAALQAF